YIIAIFTHRPVRRGMFGRVLFDPPLDYSFARIGVVAALLGGIVSVSALVLYAQGRALNELWLWLLFGALLIVVGAQFGIAFIVIRVLDELAQREATAQRDLAEPDTSST